jgi:hypothetical protein
MLQLRNQGVLCGYRCAYVPRLSGNTGKFILSGWLASQPKGSGQTEEELNPHNLSEFPSEVEGRCATFACLNRPPTFPFALTQPSR